LVQANDSIVPKYNLSEQNATLLESRLTLFLERVDNYDTLEQREVFIKLQSIIPVYLSRYNEGSQVH